MDKLLFLTIYHLNLSKDEIGENILLVGDPGRVKIISNKFDKIECQIQNREFVTHTGIFKGKRISAISTGIGTDNIDIVVNELDKMLKNICIYNVIPTIKEEILKTLNFNGHPFPFIGSDLDRKTYTKYFNEQLKKACDENGFIFFDIYDQIIDENGNLKKELSDGNSHLRDGKALNEFINNHLL